MSDDLRKLLFVMLGVAAVISVLIVGVPRWLGAAAGPEVEIVTELKRAEKEGVELDVPGGGKIVSTKLSYERISVVVTGERAVATATLDFDGTFGPTAVSSLGHERVPFRLRDGEWQPEAGLAPQLTTVVATLEHRRRALEAGTLASLCVAADAGQGTQGDLDALLRVTDRKLRATSWLIRSERDEVTVSEDFRLGGQLPERPVDDVGTRRLSLQGAAADGGEFCFPAGLM